MERMLINVNLGRRTGITYWKISDYVLMSSGTKDKKEKFSVGCDKRTQVALKEKDLEQERTVRDLW